MESKKLYIIIDKYGFEDVAHMSDEEVTESIADGFKVQLAVREEQTQTERTET